MINHDDFQYAKTAIKDKSAALCVVRMTAGDAHIVKKFVFNKNEGPEFGVETTDGVYADSKYIKELVLCATVKEAQDQLIKK